MGEGEFDALFDAADAVGNLGEVAAAEGLLSFVVEGAVVGG